MAHFEKMLTTERIYEGKIIHVRKDIVELENNATSIREVVEHPGGVCVLAVDEQGMAFFVRQYRYGAQQVLLELPAGKLEYGEDPLACGKRELLEECGCIADEFIALSPIIPTPAYDSEVIHIYLAKGLHPARQSLDEDEFLTVEKLSIEQVAEMILEGDVPDAKTQSGVLQYLMGKAKGIY